MHDNTFDRYISSLSLLSWLFRPHLIGLWSVQKKTSFACVYLVEEKPIAASCCKSLLRNCNVFSIAIVWINFWPFPSHTILLSLNFCCLLIRYSISQMKTLESNLAHRWIGMQSSFVHLIFVHSSFSVVQRNLWMSQGTKCLHAIRNYIRMMKLKCQHVFGINTRPWQPYLRIHVINTNT